MAEFFDDPSQEIERIFLWQALEGAFRTHADFCGVQLATVSLENIINPPKDSQEAQTRLVLADEPHEDDDTLQLWAEASGGNLISKVSILYFDTSGQETYNYALTPDSIAQHSPRPTLLDFEDLTELRADVNEATWSAERSKKCAEGLLFFA